MDRNKEITNSKEKSSLTCLVEKKIYAGPESKRKKEKTTLEND